MNDNIEFQKLKKVQSAIVEKREDDLEMTDDTQSQSTTKSHPTKKKKKTPPPEVFNYMLVAKIRDTQIHFSYLVQAQLVEAESMILPPPQLPNTSPGVTRNSGQGS